MKTYNEIMVQANEKTTFTRLEYINFEFSELPLKRCKDAAGQ